MRVLAVILGLAVLSGESKMSSQWHFFTKSFNQMTLQVFHSADRRIGSPIFFPHFKYSSERNLWHCPSLSKRLPCQKRAWGGLEETLGGSGRQVQRLLHGPELAGRGSGGDHQELADQPRTGVSDRKLSEWCIRFFAPLTNVWTFYPACYGTHVVFDGLLTLLVF